MSEWWSYRPTDFLLFSSRTYHRLFELYNADIWPLQLVALLAGAAILLLMRGRQRFSGHAIAVILAACWLWIAWAFHWQRYATINWAANYFAVAFAVEALLLLLSHNRLRFDSLNSGRARFGVAILLFALLVQPLIGLLVHRQWTQIEVFGVTPDPTAVATIGLLLAVSRVNWLALLIPALWCLISGATLYVMSAR